MFTSLDLLVVVFMALAAVTLLSLSLLFLIRSKKVQRICFYIVSALGVYMAYVGIRIGFGMFPIQVAIGIAVVLACIGAFVLERVSKGNEKMFLIARIISASALVLGLFNAVL
jgi:hypothetical protein